MQTKKDIPPERISEAFFVERTMRLADKHNVHIIFDFEEKVIEIKSGSTKDQINFIREAEDIFDGKEV